MTGPGDRERRAEQDEERLSGLAASYRKAEPYMAASTTLVVSVAAFLWLGIWLDRKLGTKVPWFTMAGAVVGMAAGFISFFRKVLGTKKTK